MSGLDHEHRLSVAKTPPAASSAAFQSGPEVRFEKLLRFHVEQLTPQDRQRSALLLKSGAGGDFDELVKRSPAGEALLIDGEVVACAGLLDMRQGRARAWALIGATPIPRRVWVDMRRRMRAAIDAALAGDGWAHRVDAETALDWSGGHMLLMALGFAFEAALAGTLADGGHSALYARLSSKVKPLPLRYGSVMGIAQRVIYEDVVFRAAPRNGAA